MTKLEESETRLRCCVADFELTIEDAGAIADELDWLRAELAALKGEAERTVYVGATDANHALNIRLCWQDDEDDARNDTAMQASEGYTLHAVRLSARKVEP